MFKVATVALTLAAGVAAAPRAIISAGSTNSLTTCCEVPLTFIFSEQVQDFNSVSPININGAPSTRGDWAQQPPNNLPLVEDPSALGRRFFATLLTRAADVSAAGSTPDVQYCIQLPAGAASSVIDGSLSTPSGDFCFRVRKTDPLVVNLASDFQPITYTEVIPFSASFSSAGAPRAVSKVREGTEGIAITTSDASPLPAGTSRISGAKYLTSRWEFQVTARVCESVTVSIARGAAVDQYFLQNVGSAPLTKTQFCEADQDCGWTWNAYGACDADPAEDGTPRGLRYRTMDIYQPSVGNGRACRTMEGIQNEFVQCQAACSNPQPTCINRSNGQPFNCPRAECLADCQFWWGSMKTCDIPSWRSCRGEEDLCVVKQYGLTEEQTARIYVDPLRLDQKPEAEIVADGTIYTCDCGANCFIYGDCCEDRADLCGVPVRVTSCNGRCGESSEIYSVCSCDADCAQRLGGCCDDLIAECPEASTCSWLGCGFYGGPDRCACDAGCTRDSPLPDRCCADFDSQQCPGGF